MRSRCRFGVGVDPQREGALEACAQWGGEARHDGAPVAMRWARTWQVRSSRSAEPGVRRGRGAARGSARRAHPPCGRPRRRVRRDSRGGAGARRPASCGLRTSAGEALRVDAQGRGGGVGRPGVTARPVQRSFRKSYSKDGMGGREYVFAIRRAEVEDCLVGCMSTSTQEGELCRGAERANPRFETELKQLVEEVAGPVGEGAVKLSQAARCKHH